MTTIPRPDANTVLRRTAALLDEGWRDSSSLSTLCVSHDTGLRIELDDEDGQTFVYPRFGENGEYGPKQCFVWRRGTEASARSLAALIRAMAAAASAPTAG
ncbi:hypothetical protein [Kitasatospora sp. NPDC090091]|uniref:hypothetical protein n=1 Tax=Kitasatospora sp. NPDC090091 TaxID=3364081 RepID=UPI0038187530